MFSFAVSAIVDISLTSIFLSHSHIQGARVNAKDNKWLTPLHRAVASCSEVTNYTSTPLLMCSVVTLLVMGMF